MSGWITVLVGTFAPTIALVGYLMTVSTNKKQRIITSIGTQRIDWINKLRGEFVNYNSRCLKYELIRFSQSVGLNDSYDVAKDYQAVLSSQNHIELLLNPRELFVKELIKEMKAQTDLLLGGNYDKNKVESSKNRIGDLQQIILKAEWERVRIETEEGKQVKTSEMESILRNTALKINRKVYSELILNDELNKTI
ncbi:hypothetical protein [Sporosarcina sp. ITBMC105]